MRLVLIRHAEAEDAGLGGDAARRLTEQGRRRFRRAARGLAALDVKFDLVLHSPLARATETAALLAKLVDGPLRAELLLAAPPGAALLAALAALDAPGISGAADAPGGPATVGCVGHEPWLGQLAVILCARRADDATSAFELALDKGGAITLAGRARPGGMRLEALYPARSLRRLRRWT